MSSAQKIKLPEFIDDDPATWFLTCEAIFHTQKVIKDEDKYFHLVAALPSKITHMLKDVLTLQPYTDENGKLVDPRFSTLKDRLLALFARDEYESYVQLVNFPSLGLNQKPSTLLSNMLAMVPSGIKIDDVWQFKCLFLHKLPPLVRQICKTQQFPSLMSLALFADTVLEPSGLSSSPLCAVASGQLNSDSRTVTGPATLSSVSSGEFPDQENTSSDGWCCAVRSNMGKHRRSAQVLCFYHQRFGNKANTCEGQCSWKNQAQGNASRARRH